MNYLSFILLLIVLGVCLFFLVAAIIIYRQKFVRRGKPGAAPVPKSFDGKEVAMKGFDEELTRHVHDPVIMKPLLDAKHRWADYPLEKITAIGEHGTILKADFWAADGTDETTVHPKVAVLVHGLLDSSAGMAYLAEEYHKLGYSVLAVNMRGHGESEGKLYGIASVDAKDLLRWLDVLDARFKGEAENVRYVLHGVSMGGSAVLIAAGLPTFAERFAQKTTLIVADSTFSSFSMEMRDQFEVTIPGSARRLFRFLLLKALSVVTWATGHGTLSHISPEKSMAKVAQRMNAAQKAGGATIANLADTSVASATQGTAFPPVLLFHGLEDVLVRPYNAMKVYERMAGQKEVCFVEKAPHIGAYFYEPEQYMAAIKKYL